VTRFQLDSLALRAEIRPAACPTLHADGGWPGAMPQTAVSRRRLADARACVGGAGIAIVLSLMLSGCGEPLVRPTPNVLVSPVVVGSTPAPTATPTNAGAPVAGSGTATAPARSAVVATLVGGTPTRAAPTATPVRSSAATPTAVRSPTSTASRLSPTPGVPAPAVSASPARPALPPAIGAPLLPPTPTATAPAAPTARAAVPSATPGRAVPTAMPDRTGRVAVNGLTFEAPAGWQRLGAEPAWVGAGGARLSVTTAEVTPGWQPMLLLPNHARVVSSVPVKLAWGEGFRYTLERTGTAAQGGQVEAYETHVIVQAGGQRAYDFHLVARTEAALAQLDPVLRRTVESAALAGR